MGGGVEEVFGEGDEGFVAHFLDEGVHAHGVDEFLVANRFAILESHKFAVCVDFGDRSVGSEFGVLFGQSVGDGDPDAACAAVGWEAEGCVGAPVTGGLLQDDVLGYGLEIWRSYSLAEPLALHLQFISFILER